jgi:hypothetical protein
LCFFVIFLCFIFFDKICFSFVRIFNLQCN